MRKRYTQIQTVFLRKLRKKGPVRSNGKKLNKFVIQDIATVCSRSPIFMVYFLYKNGHDFLDKQH